MSQPTAVKYQRQKMTQIDMYHIHTGWTGWSNENGQTLVNQTHTNKTSFIYDKCSPLLCCSASV